MGQGGSELNTGNKHDYRPLMGRRRPKKEKRGKGRLKAKERNKKKIPPKKTPSGELRHV